jgi:hypothetical protein
MIIIGLKSEIITFLLRYYGSNGWLKSGNISLQSGFILYEKVFCHGFIFIDKGLERPPFSRKIVLTIGLKLNRVS